MISIFLLRCLSCLIISSNLEVSLKLISNVFLDKTFEGMNIFRDENYTVLSYLFLRNLDLRYKPDSLNYIKIRYVNV